MAGASSGRNAPAWTTPNRRVPKRAGCAKFLPMKNRREFLRGVAYALAAAQLSSSQVAAQPFEVGESPSIGQVIKAILGAVPAEGVNDTVDTVKHGDTGRKLTGVATTFLPTCQVIERAASKNANLLITHEPTFYNHLDETDWLKDSEVYHRKRRLLDESGMVVWRFHDFWHRLKPDPVTEALLEQLGLSEAQRGQDGLVVRIAETPLRDLAASFKQRLGLPLVRVVGNPSALCRRIGILPGAWGGRMQIGLLERERPDAVVCGEINEWETNVYVKDAIWTGRNTSLILLGHVNTEEPGMRALADWLRPRLPGVAIRHVPMGDPFLYL